MANWRHIENDAPEFAARVRGRFEAGTNKTIATLRRDGGPRVSASPRGQAAGTAWSSSRRNVAVCGTGRVVVLDGLGEAGHPGVYAR
jgi:hypothetical protein